MNWFDLNGVYRLEFAENNVLQVLIDRFDLYRIDNAAHLEISFGDQSPAIRRRETKRTVKEGIPNFESEAKAIQKSLEGLLLDGNPTAFHHNKNDFVFRYSNGGSLPVIEYCGNEYYALFYRDVHPIGWNIANGASDTVEEMLNPAITIERELCEELIVLDLANKKDYAFSLGTGKTLERPEFDAARKLWDRFFVEDIDIRQFERSPLPVRWDLGPDRITISIGDEEPRTVTGGYLNINAEDFGIEFDRIAHIQIEDDALLLDGEINDNKLLIRPIGLFRTSRFSDKIDETSNFRPDHLFWGAQKFPPDQIENVLDRYFFPRLIRQGIRTVEDLKKFQESETSSRLGLCPVTRQIIMRHQKRKGEEKREPTSHKTKDPNDGSRVSQAFISYSHKDGDKVQKLVRHLRERGIKVWADKEKIRPSDNWRRSIDSALKESSHLLFLVTSNSSDSDEVLAEVDYAYKRIPVVPLLFEEGQAEAPPRYYQSTLQFIKFTDFNLGMSVLLEYLLESD